MVNASHGSERETRVWLALAIPWTCGRAPGRQPGSPRAWTSRTGGARRAPDSPSQAGGPWRAVPRPAGLPRRTSGGGSDLRVQGRRRRAARRVWRRRRAVSHCRPRGRRVNLRMQRPAIPALPALQRGLAEQSRDGLRLRVRLRWRTELLGEEATEPRADDSAYPGRHALHACARAAVSVSLVCRGGGARGGGEEEEGGAYHGSIRDAQVLVAVEVRQHGGAGGGAGQSGDGAVDDPASPVQQCVVTAAMSLRPVSASVGYGWLVHGVCGGPCRHRAMCLGRAGRPCSIYHQFVADRQSCYFRKRSQKII